MTNTTMLPEQIIAIFERKGHRLVARDKTLTVSKESGLWIYNGCEKCGVTIFNWSNNQALPCTGKGGRNGR